MMLGIEQIIYIFLVILALWSVFARNLKHAIITSGVFGLWASLTYLFYHAPDVAVSEAIVASALSTVLLILTIRNYKDISISKVPAMVWHRAGSDILLIGSCALVLFLATRIPSAPLAPLHYHTVDEYLTHGVGVNPITSILLYYRGFDTVFEALMLLTAVLGVVHLIEPKTQDEPIGFGEIVRLHPTMIKSIQVLTPVMIVAGFALITGDPTTPGGGFQGAGLLVAVVVSRYMLRPVDMKVVRSMETLEKVVYVVFLGSVFLYGFMGTRQGLPHTYMPFTIAMNALLGVKVFCGLAIVFLFFAGGDNSQTAKNEQLAQIQRAAAPLEGSRS